MVSGLTAVIPVSEADAHAERNEQLPIAAVLDVSGTGHGPDDGYFALNHDLVRFIGLLFMLFIAFSKFCEARLFAWETEACCAGASCCSL